MTTSGCLSAYLNSSTLELTAWFNWAYNFLICSHMHISKNRIYLFLDIYLIMHIYETCFSVLHINTLRLNKLISKTNMLFFNVFVYITNTEKLNNKNLIKILNLIQQIRVFIYFQHSKNFSNIIFRLKTVKYGLTSKKSGLFWASLAKRGISLWTYTG